MPKLILGLHESGRVLHVGDVASGLACKCKCLDCGEPLVARKGEILEHHFGHTSGREHDWAWESHLHAYAKQLIIDAGGLEVPLHAAVAPLLDADTGATSARLAAGDMEIQQEVVVGKVRPDLLLRCRTREVPVALEILVTHGATREKRDAFRRQRLPALEIDLSRFPPERFDAARVREVVLHATHKKTWLWPLPPRPNHTRAPVPLADEVESEVDFDVPQGPVGPPPPLPGQQKHTFAVPAWNAHVEVTIEPGEDSIAVEMSDTVIGRMPSTNAEQAAPRIAQLVGRIIESIAGIRAERAGRWLVPAWHAPRIAAAISAAALENASGSRGTHHEDAGYPSRSQLTQMGDNAYARRRG